MKISKVFWTTFSFFILIALFSMGKNVMASHTTSLETQIEQLDQQIEDLSDLKREYEVKALRNENQAQRLQFIQKEFLTAKRHWKLAEKNRKQADKVAKKITVLEKRREKLLQNYQAHESDPSSI